MNVNTLNLYNTNPYEPLTPQTLPFDTYPLQSLSKPLINGKNINQIISSSTNVLMNTPQTPLTYSSGSINKPASTLVNLLHQKRSPLVDQPISREKQSPSVRQPRKSTQKKAPPKRSVSINNNNIQVNLNETFFCQYKHFFL